MPSHLKLHDLLLLLAELNDAVTKTRTSEKDLTDASTAKSDPAVDSASLLAAQRAKQSSYADYMSNANDAKIVFESLTGRRITDDKLKPTVTI